MNEVALAIQHDVSVVSVFDLQQEEQQTVGGHTADEVVPCLHDKTEREKEGGEYGYEYGEWGERLNH